MRSLGRQELSKDEAAGTRSLRARGGRGAERALPEPFARWFADRGWQPRPHQLALLDAAEQRRSTLLIAPTGAGKTLAGFLPSLVNLAQRRRDKRENKGAGLHTLYISPLKALAVDVARNLMAPIAEMSLPIRTETRTGDTPVSRRQRQRVRPPDILMTTPEQLALLLSHPDCGASVRRPRHRHPRRAARAEHRPSAATCWRSTSRGCARSRRKLMSVGSVGNGGAPLRAARLPRAASAAATVHRAGRSRARRGRRQAGNLDPRDRRAGAVGRPHDALRHRARSTRRSRAHRLTPRVRQHAHAGGAAVPGAVARSTTPACRSRCTTARSTPQRAQGRGGDGGGHAARRRRHLDARPRHRLGRRRPRHQRRRAEGREPASSSASAAPTTASTSLRRRSWCPSTASRCWSAAPRSMRPMAGAQDAVLSRAGRARRARPARARHGVRRRRSSPTRSMREVRIGRALRRPHARQLRPRHRLRGDRRLRAQDLRALCAPEARRPTARCASRIRASSQHTGMNVGTIVAAPMIKVRLVGRRSARGSEPRSPGGRMLGEVDEYFIEQLRPGRRLRASRARCCVSKACPRRKPSSRAPSAKDPIIPSYDGGKFPLSTHLAARVRAMLAD